MTSPQPPSVLESTKHLLDFRHCSRPWEFSTEGTALPWVWNTPAYSGGLQGSASSSHTAAPPAIWVFDRELDSHPSQAQGRTWAPPSPAPQKPHPRSWVEFPLFLLTSDTQYRSPLPWIQAPGPLPTQLSEARVLPDPSLQPRYPPAPSLPRPVSPHRRAWLARPVLSHCRHASRRPFRSSHGTLKCTAPTPVCAPSQAPPPSPPATGSSSSTSHFRQCLLPEALRDHSYTSSLSPVDS